MKCPHLYLDLCILVLYTRIIDTTFKHEPLRLSQQFGDHVATICPHGLLQHCREHEMSAWYAYKLNQMYCTNHFINLAVTPTSGQPELDTL